MLTKLKFLELVKEAPELEILEECADSCVVGCPKSKKVSQVNYEQMERNPLKNWDQVKRTLTGEREPQILSHVTRIVGYYSSIENWNQSKIGELKDRQKGDYSLATSK